MREEALAVLGLNVGDGLEELAQEEIVPPLNRILRVGAVAGAFAVGEEFGVGLVGGEAVLGRADTFELDKPRTQGVLSALKGVFFQAMGNQRVKGNDAVAL